MSSLHAKNLIKKLDALTNTPKSIQSLSSWLSVYRKKIPESIAVWKGEILKEDLSSGKILTLLYLANDVVQTSLKKIPEFAQQWQDIFRVVVPKIAPRMDQKDVDRVKRMFGIWADRKVYDASFCNQLISAMDAGRKSSGGSSSRSAPKKKKVASSGSRPEPSSPPHSPSDEALQKMPFFNQLREKLVALSKLPYQGKNQDDYEDLHQSRIQSLLSRGSESTAELKRQVPTLENIIDSYKDELKKKEDLIRFLDRERQNLEDQTSVMKSLYLPRWEQLLNQVNETVDRKRKFQSFDDDYNGGGQQHRHGRMDPRFDGPPPPGRMDPRFSGPPPLRHDSGRRDPRDPRAHKRMRPNEDDDFPPQPQQPQMSSSILNEPPPDLSDIDALLGSIAHLEGQ